MKLSLRRVLILFAAMFFALATGVTGAQAVTNFDNAPEGAHYARGEAEPVCTVENDNTVTCTDTAIAGVGNTNAFVELAVTRTFTGECRNPGSKEKVVDPFTESATTTDSAELTPSRNGRLTVDERSATVQSEEEFLDTFSCPNPNWEADVTDTGISYVYTLTFDGFTEPAIEITG